MNLPNKLTVVRIFLIPLFIICLVVPFSWGQIGSGANAVTVTSIVAMVIFVAASLTDFIDGQIARRQHLVTNFGKFADPLADKMLVMTAFIILVEHHQVPAWVAAIIVCRELAVTGLRLLAVENESKVIAAAMPGKIKTTTQMLSIIFLLVNNFGLGFPVGQIFLYICLFFTVYSGIDYFWQSRELFADSINN